MGQVRHPNSGQRVEGQAQAASRTFLVALMLATRPCVCLSVRLQWVGREGAWGQLELMFSEAYTSVQSWFFSFILIIFTHFVFFSPPPHNFGFCGFYFSFWFNVS